MILKYIHKFQLKNVKLEPKQTDCFLHDFDLLGVSTEDLRDELEGQIIRVYLGVMNNFKIGTKCFWCFQKFQNEKELLEHTVNVHYKTLKAMKVLRLQEELYRHKLNLFRAGVIDATYFAYTNWLCQHCDDRNARGRGLCSIPESARNKVRSLNVLGLSADGILPGFKGYNFGFIIGKPMKNENI